MCWNVSGMSRAGGRLERISENFDRFRTGERRPTHYILAPERVRQINGRMAVKSRPNHVLNRFHSKRVTSTSGENDDIRATRISGLKGQQHARVAGQLLYIDARIAGHLFHNELSFRARNAARLNYPVSRTQPAKPAHNA